MALVLTRKVGESLQIGDAVVTVWRIKGGTIRLGITAPPSVKIVRTELKLKEEPRNEQ